MTVRALAVRGGWCVPLWLLGARRGEGDAHDLLLLTQFEAPSSEAPPGCRSLAKRECQPVASTELVSVWGFSGILETTLAWRNKVSQHR